jgi:hypothetical protein
MDDLLLLLAPLKSFARLPQHTEHKTQHSTTQTQHNKVFFALNRTTSARIQETHTHRFLLSRNFGCEWMTSPSERTHSSRLGVAQERENTQQSIPLLAMVKDHTAVTPLNWLKREKTQQSLR